MLAAQEWLTEGILPGNPGQVQTALENLYYEGNTTVDGIFLSLDPLDIDDAQDAFQYMNPSMYKGMAVAQENNAVTVRSAISQRFQNVLDDPYRYACLQPSKPRKTHLWSSGFGEFVEQSTTYTYDSEQYGYQDNTGGFAIGLDRQFGRTYLGTLGGYTHSHIHWECDWGKGNVDSGYFGLYASAIGDLLYVNISAIGAWSYYKAHRNIFFPQDEQVVDVTANNKHHGRQLISHIDSGLNFLYKGITIRPFESVDWILQKEDGYTETRAGEYNLNVYSSITNMLRNELGFNFASCGYFRSRFKLIADAKISWVGEARYRGKEATSTFDQTSVPFTVIGYFPYRNLCSMGCSLTGSLLQEKITCGNNPTDPNTTNQDILTMTIYYNGNFGKDYADDSIAGQLNYAF